MSVSEFPARMVVEPKCIVHNTPLARRGRLAELGVSEALIVEALQRGLAEKLTAVIYDPNSAGGFDLYRYVTRHIREGQHQLGWELSDRGNVAQVRDPSSGTTLIVCAGDAQTGQVIGSQPRTKRQRGDVFLEISEVLQLDLFDDDVVANRRISPPSSNVWLLLHYHEMIGEEHVFRAELSRPFEAEGGMITRWSERIIIHVTPPGTVHYEEVENDEGSDIKPTVKVNL